LANTSDARGRIALSGGGLRPPGPVGGFNFCSWRERAEPMNAAPLSQGCERPQGPAGAYSPVRVPLLSCSRKRGGAQGRQGIRIVRALLTGPVTAAVQVAKSAADGYTIMMATSGTMAMNTTLYRKLPYEPGKDLVLVALICHVPFVLVVNPELPVNSVADLVKLAKERQLSYGSGGAGAFHHLMGE